MASAMSFLGTAFTAQLLLVSLLGQPLVTAADDHMGQVTIHARLIDWECWNRMRRGEATVDGSDIMLSPQDHKAGCLQVAVCKASGYYLAVQCNTGNYAPLYTLNEDNATIAAVAAYVDTLTPGDMTDISVTVTGTNHNGEIQDAMITACTGTTSQCDHGTCTGACTSSYTDMYDGFEGCVADDVDVSLAHDKKPGFLLIAAALVVLGRTGLAVTG